MLIVVTYSKAILKAVTLSWAILVTLPEVMLIFKQFLGATVLNIS